MKRWDTSEVLYLIEPLRLIAIKSKATSVLFAPICEIKNIINLEIQNEI